MTGTYGDVYGDIYGDVPGEGDSSVPYVKFVTAVGSLTTRLDLSPGTGGLQVSTPDGTGRLDDAVDFGRPRLAVTTAAGSTADGDPYVASSYGNVRFTLPLVLPSQVSMDARQAALGALARELDRDSNVLYVQAEGATTGRWMITYRHADAATWLRLALRAAEVRVTLDRAPFAYGAAVTAWAGQVFTADPETAVGNWTASIPAITGDVDAPLSLAVYHRTDGVNGPPADRFALAARQLVYDDATLIYVLTAADAAIANVTTGVTSTGAVGTANRWTPPNSAEAYVFGGPLPGHSGSPTASREIHGRWHIYARVRRGTSTDVFTLRARLRTAAAGAGTGPLLAPTPITIPAASLANWTYVDLGLLQVPQSARRVGPDPWGDPTPASSPAVDVHATRVSGAGTLDIDHMLAVPADGRTLIVDVNGASLSSPASAVQLDADRNTAAVVQLFSTSPYVDSVQPAAGWDGGMLVASPRYATQVFGLPDLTMNGSTAKVLNVVATYRPRYLDAL